MSAEDVLAKYGVRTQMPDKSKVVQEANKIVASKKYKYGQSRKSGYEDDDMMDCSEFVMHAYRKAGFSKFPALSSRVMAQRFPCTKNPVPGDIIYWSFGHVAILVDPDAGTFVGAQSEKSGLCERNYKEGWWATKTGRSFLVYSE